MPPEDVGHQSALDGTFCYFAFSIFRALHPLGEQSALHVKMQGAWRLTGGNQDAVRKKEAFQCALRSTFGSGGSIRS